MCLRIKRFSQNIHLEEERLFGKHNLLEKSIGSVKLGIRRARKWAADELHKGVKKDVAKNRLAGRNFDKNVIKSTDLLNSSPQDRAAGRRLYRKGRDLGYTATHTRYSDGVRYVANASQMDFRRATNGYNRICHPQDARNYFARKMINDAVENPDYNYLNDPSFLSLHNNLEKGKNVISLPKFSRLKKRKAILSLGEASHELGHAVNSSTKNINYRMRDKLSTVPNIEARRKGKKLGIVKSTISDIATIGEEKRATKEGLKLLKKSGASKEMMNLANKETKYALDTYKYNASKNFKARLRDSIDPIGPGRYGNSISRYSGYNGIYLPT